MTSKNPSGPSAFEVGQLCTFRTAPVYNSSASPTNRFGAAKILAVKPNWVLVALLGGVLDSPPDLDGAKSLPFVKDHSPLRSNEFSVTWAPDVSDTGLADFRILGKVSMTASETLLAAGNHSYASSWDGVSQRVELPWRRGHDAATLEAELGLTLKDNAARAAQVRARYETRLKSLTWDKLLGENLLASWDLRDPPFPPPAFVSAVRIRLRDTIAALKALGPKPKKAAARAILKDCVEWLNRANAEHGRVIETEEREDLHGVLEEFAFVAGHPGLSDEIEDWREW